MKTLGILLSALFPTQCNFYAINRMNEWVKDPQNDGIIFYENISQPLIRPCFSVMNISEAYTSKSIMISTNISTTAKLINMVSPIKKYFYVYDLEWMRFNPKQSWELMQQFYTHKDINLIAKNIEHKKIIENAWNREVKFIMNDFDIKVLNDL